MRFEEISYSLEHRFAGNIAHVSDDYASRLNARLGVGGRYRSCKRQNSFKRTAPELSVELRELQEAKQQAKVIPHPGCGALSPSTRADSRREFPR
jgi:hypothetical protein